jgi:hypothetical protein
LYEKDDSIAPTVYLEYINQQMPVLLQALVSDAMLLKSSPPTDSVGFDNVRSACALDRWAYVINRSLAYIVAFHEHSPSQQRLSSSKIKKLVHRLCIYGDKSTRKRAFAWLLNIICSSPTIWPDWITATLASSFISHARAPKGIIL